MTDIENRTLAMAGVLQACDLVSQLARRGQCNTQFEEASVHSILVLDALNSAAVFGGIQGVQHGLKLLSDGVMSSASAENVELIRYTMSILHLQNQLYRDTARFTAFGQDVERLSQFSKGELVAACSELYQTHISGMRPQIIVQGEQDFLQREEIPPRVRGLLLAAIRSAVLWQQKGGSRFKMLLERSKYKGVAGQLLS